VSDSKTVAPTSIRSNCKHQLVQVLYHNPLGVTVGCVRCDTTFDMPYENIERYFLDFKHNSPSGPDSDITLLINKRVFK
jgi:hypothetical protein